MSPGEKIVLLRERLINEKKIVIKHILNYKSILMTYPHKLNLLTTYQEKENYQIIEIIK